MDSMPPLMSLLIIVNMPNFVIVVFASSNPNGKTFLIIM